jgi:hypothetical protein
MCASELESVERPGRVSPEASGNDRVRIAQALLDELQAPPSATEQEAGFTTYVPTPLKVAGARPGDPAGTLRLSTQPEGLTAAALSQIVCTFAEGGAARGDTGHVVLGGPAPYAPTEYRCDQDVKTDPDAPVPTAGPARSAPDSTTEPHSEPPSSS